MTLGITSTVSSSRVNTTREREREREREDEDDAREKDAVIH